MIWGVGTMLQRMMGVLLRRLLDATGVVILAAGLTVTVAACAVGSPSQAVTSMPPASPATSAAASAASSLTRISIERGGGSRRSPVRRRQGGRVGPSGLVYSTASNEIVQPQPRPGRCHAIGVGRYSRPDPRCTPGVQIVRPIVACVTAGFSAPGWTSTVRPPERNTEREKALSMAAYGDRGPMGNYEYDHFVALELGGATNDPRNLWPEPGSSPNRKDVVENELNQRVCAGQMTLAAAQRAIARNWVALARRGKSNRTASCTLSARYDAQYNDYDVYVSSNQPDQQVTVTDTSGHRGSWHTDGAGYAEVYFYSGGPKPGDRITARVGSAVCSASL